MPTPGRQPTPRTPAQRKRASGRHPPGYSVPDSQRGRPSVKLTLSPGEHDALEAVAARWGRSRSYVVGRLVRWVEGTGAPLSEFTDAQASDDDG